MAEPALLHISRLHGEPTSGNSLTVGHIDMFDPAQELKLFRVKRIRLKGAYCAFYPALFLLCGVVLLEFITHTHVYKTLTFMQPPQS